MSSCIIVHANSCPATGRVNATGAQRSLDGRGKRRSPGDVTDKDNERKRERERERERERISPLLFLLDREPYRVVIMM